jgi:tripartite-type tricarboxylate transporter receptor subunit TctC
VARSALLPDVPSVSVSALPGYNVKSWYGLFSPTGTTAAIVDKLNTEVAALLKAPVVAERLSAMGAQASPTTPEEFARIVRSEVARWAPVVKASGASVN